MVSSLAVLHSSTSFAPLPQSVPSERRATQTLKLLEQGSSHRNSLISHMNHHLALSRACFSLGLGAERYHGTGNWAPWHPDCMQHSTACASQITMWALTQSSVTHPSSSMGLSYHMLVCYITLPHYGTRVPCAMMAMNTLLFQML